ncbi:MAG: bifunctional DNA-formamidopyrimidine glycosylase/DNA-(apurinic or apyrimidinic site) lyase [Spirochaetes bacterium]|nr:bifunctional DNA-formamidopyrimidine glycosylase/DNA-(apurinic or apyrimidinic site) lyase [Spirochaetota bacterium]MBU0956996.1 bifunctional DNA-formamidopyrimidine glycosylase/DNA-(apurinic or apyrimidinic site) lyase [Spirochaetota bacterium]
MPELPEVETVRRGLQELLVGRRISSIDCNWSKSFAAAGNQSLIGAAFREIRRRGKLLMLELDNEHTLLIHLKMTGQLVFVADNGLRFGAGHPSDSLVDQLPDASTRVIFFLDDARLFFNDQRKFGRIQLVANQEVPADSFLQRLGPEPLGPDFSKAGFGKALQRRSGTSIKAALLDQSVVAGIGNIYADEALWKARIHPDRRAGSLSPAELGRLFKAIPEVLQLSIDHGGSSDRNYVNAEGKRGAYLDFAAVFRRQGQSCPRCQSIIVKTRVAGRGTHLCPNCQRLFGSTVGLKR